MHSFKLISANIFRTIQKLEALLIGKGSTVLTGKGNSAKIIQHLSYGQA